MCHNSFSNRDRKGSNYNGVIAIVVAAFFVHKEIIRKEQRTWAYWLL